jgi:hypothetical protein
VANKTMPCAENNELIDTFTKRGSKCSGDALTLLGSADVYGGGSEYFRFWRLPLSSFSWIRFLAQWRARLELCQWRAKTLYSEPGSPWENGHCESFNSKLRDEFLNPEIFYSMKELRVLERWRIHYNTVRPHFSLGYRPPAPETWMTSTSKGNEKWKPLRASHFPNPDGGYLNSEVTALNQLIQRYKRPGSPRSANPFTNFGHEHCISPTKSFCLKQYSLRGGTYEFKNLATHREWDRDCPSVRTVCARSFLSIRCG